MKKKLIGRSVVPGKAEGKVLLSKTPISFLGGIDPETGIFIEPGHPLEGISVAGRILAFPTGKGSTVGSYVIYRLVKTGLGPAAIVNASSEAIVAAGAIIAGVPLVDHVDLAQMKDGMYVVIDDGEITLE